jgi:hypothetical protein
LGLLKNVASLNNSDSLNANDYLYNLTGMYTVAREKLKRAEDTSTLETDNDEESRVRRKRSRQTHESDDEQHEDTQPGACKKLLIKKSLKTRMPLPLPPASLQQSAFVKITSISGN